MLPTGMKLSEFIKELQKLEQEGYGDREVIAGGGDYPEGVRGVRIQEQGNPYTPKGSIKIV